MTIELIEEIIQKYGWVGGGVIIFALLIYALIKTKAFNSAFAKVLDRLTDKLFKRKKKVIEEEPNVVRVSDSDIINHEIFNYIDFWVYSKVPTLQFSTDFRTYVFKKYLKIYFKSYKDVMHIFVNSGDFKSMDNSKFRTSLLKMITDIIADYETEMLREGIPNIIIDKMKSRNLDTLNLTLDLLNSICDSSFYDSPNNLLKMYSAMNIILSILENTMSTVEEVCNSINGQLSGIELDGYKEP